MVKLNVNENNQVMALCRAGNDWVKTAIDKTIAEMIIEKGKIEKSNHKEYPVSVDNDWMFDGKIETKKKGK